MNELLHYYNQELTSLRKQGEQFANAYPKIAGRIRLASGGVEDPFVGRLVESFAYLTAKARQQFDHELDHITENLLSILYPHYLLPIPAMSIAKFELQDKAESTCTIERHTQLTSETGDGERCLFRTAYPVVVKPILIDQLKLTTKLPLKPVANNQEIKSCFNLHLKLNSKNLNFYEDQEKIGLDKLCFYINGQLQASNDFYRLLLTKVKHIELTTANRDQESIVLSPSLIKPVGFDDEQSLLPYPATSFDAYRLLTEYSVFPQKFSFFALENLDQHLDSRFSDNLQLHFFLSDDCVTLQHEVSNDFLQLGCTPIVNLFPARAEPIRLDQKQSDYQVVADIHQNQANNEVYSVTGMEFSSTGSIDSNIACYPYFGLNYPHVTEENALYWQLIRRASSELEQGNGAGYEVYLRFNESIEQFSLTDPPVVTPLLLCTNRDLPASLPFSANKPSITFWQNEQELVKSIKTLMPMTQAQYRDQQKMQQIDLVSHLYNQQFSLSQSENALEVLKDNLALYQFGEKKHAEWIHKGLCHMSSRRVVERHPVELSFGFCHGEEITLTVDEHFFPEQNIYLLGSVLSRFFCKSNSVNAFTRLIIHCKQSGETFRWKQQLGAKASL